MNPTTLHDVAREAGVSLATASRVVNGSARKVAEEYRERVMAAAKKLNYTPNLSAQAVARGTSNTVSLIVADIADPYFSTIAAGVNRAAEEEGLIVTVAVTGRSPRREVELVRSLRAQRPKVMILAGSRYAKADENAELADELASYAGLGGQVVFISQREFEYPTVDIRNEDGARDLARSLSDLGYRRFAILAGPAELMTAAQRVRGFRAGLQEAGVTVPEANIIRGPFSRDGAYDSMKALVDRGLDDVDLVFGVSDVMAIGAMTAIHDAGLRVPEDVAVAGFDDVFSAVDVMPPLTTVRIPLEDVGVKAVRIALGLSEEQSAVEAEVVLRGSTPGI
ncbi:LacI family DNA-binding transcriptional regulator [Lysobacter korlensis]|uniref:LacI family DNA-binding transcriptional regulator n=1 Tax=Lysobacter korlensis TaxID=553636 RepID=A0ABV6RS65_9GAMM